jgi:hypothetical protein
MQVARNRDVVETKLAADANLTITGVVKLLASPGSGAPGDVDEALDAIPSEVPPFAVLAVGKLLPEPEAST